jgi:transglutaminase-like putative cysteine protease
VTPDFAPFLESTAVVDWQEPRVLALARRLGRGVSDALAVARVCFDWVRDEIPHTGDHPVPTVTCSASEVLAARTGFCYAKSHLLAALLRANGIATGFCYQRLRLDDSGPRSSLKRDFTAATRAVIAQAFARSSSHRASRSPMSAGIPKSYCSTVCGVSRLFW